MVYSADVSAAHAAEFSAAAAEYQDISHTTTRALFASKETHTRSEAENIRGAGL